MVGVELINQAVGLTSPEYQATRAVILVPTRELAMQVHGFIKTLTAYCEDTISCVNVASGGSSVTRYVDRPLQIINP